VVLVHGGFADASFWGPVIKDLQAHNLPVLAPPNRSAGSPELYREAFAADLPTEITEVAAVSQRPFAAIFDDRAEAAAWKTLPSWAVVATADEAIPPDAERHMARRAGAETIEIEASHSIALSQPQAVADLIRTAVNASAAATVVG
jgi:pimeloyl-ACP methyl ester carboxylesterase